MRKLFLGCLIALSSNLYAAELNCSIKQNLDLISDVHVTTTADQKAVIDSLEGIYASVTEKTPGHFYVEAYIVDYDMRVSAVGSLKEISDSVEATAWGRTSIVEIGCQLGSALRKH